MRISVRQRNGDDVIEIRYKDIVRVEPMKNLLLGVVLLVVAVPDLLADPPCRPSVAVEDLRPAMDVAVSPGMVKVSPVLRGEIAGVVTELVSIVGPCRYTPPVTAQVEVVWLFLRGRASLETHGQPFAIAGEAIARAPLGWNWQIDVAMGERLDALRVQRILTDDDRCELARFPQNNAGPYVKRFADCPAYREAIKSPKTVSRTLLPQDHVPRMAAGTVETTGPDAVGSHRHPMLEQLFLGLKDNDITVTADAASARLAEYSLLHIPLGSSHGASVHEGKRLHYVWMDFFITKEGQEWLKMHKPVESKP